MSSIFFLLVESSNSVPHAHRMQAAAVDTLGVSPTYQTTSRTVLALHKNR